MFKEHGVYPMPSVTLIRFFIRIYLDDLDLYRVTWNHNSTCISSHMGPNILVPRTWPYKVS